MTRVATAFGVTGPARVTGRPLDRLACSFRAAWLRAGQLAARPRDGQETEILFAEAGQGRSGQRISGRFGA